MLTADRYEPVFRLPIRVTVKVGSKIRKNSKGGKLMSVKLSRKHPLSGQLFVYDMTFTASASRFLI